jgi:hypothetical protein
MTDFPDHSQLERRVQRIHQLLESAGSVVTWNDRIPDPDKPSQARQIDVSIRRDGALTLVECRLHKQPQDVNWIEELIGRRISLRANAVIAVSASGFTTTARDKAKHFGIHLRDFQTLSREEIREWGMRRTMAAHFCEFTKMKLMLTMAKPPTVARPLLTDGKGQPPSPLTRLMILQQIMSLLDKQKWDGRSIPIDAVINADLLLSGERPTQINLRGAVRRKSRAIGLTSVVHYFDSVTAAKQVDIGNYDLGTSEIIEDCDRLAMTIDLSTMQVPDSCVFETLTVDAGRVVTSHVDFIGTEAATRFNVPFGVQYRTTKF